MQRKGDDVKKMILAMFDDVHYTSCYSANDKKTLHAFVDGRQQYFSKKGLDFEAIDLYMQALNLYRRIITHRNSTMKRSVLERQAEIIHGEFDASSTLNIIS